MLIALIFVLLLLLDFALVLVLVVSCGVAPTALICVLLPADFAPFVLMVSCGFTSAVGASVVDLQNEQVWHLHHEQCCCACWVLQNEPHNL